MTVIRFWIFFLFLAIALGTSAGNDALIRIDRRSDDDRNLLLGAGVPLIAELNDAFLAVGDETTIFSTAAPLDLTFDVLDHPGEQMQYALAGLILKGKEADLRACAQVISKGQDWFLLRAASFDRPECSRSTSFVLRLLPMTGLQPTKAPPLRYRDLQAGNRRPAVIEPLIQKMVGDLTDDTAMSHWQAIIDSASTRYSHAQGCIDASADVFSLFDSLGLSPQYHTYSSSYPPNVIGVLPGTVRPDEVIIVIGHLDSTSNNNPSVFAPGADDNASGSAMVTAVAEAMSCYEFEATVKFITVTGEEQGLYGSTGYASDADSAGEDIQAVLNGDMIGFEGDTIPAAGEDLDVNTNSASVWLGNLMAQVAGDYNTGITVNAFSCPSMTYSDHAPFWTNGWSAICGITDNLGFCDEGGNYPYYHTDNDTIANCGPGAKAFEGSAIRVYLATAADLAVPIATKTTTPTGLTAQPDGDNRIALAWSTSGQGYSHQIYRVLGGCLNPGPPTLLDTITSTSFTDTAASGQLTYAYWIQSVNGRCSSVNSSCVEVTTTGACIEPPVFAGVDVVSNPRSSDCGLELIWSGTPTLYCGSTPSFTIYRSTNPAFIPSPANTIAENVSGSPYLDADSLVSGQRYHYIVRAVDDANSIEDRNVHRMSGIPTGPMTIGTWTDDAGDNGGSKLVLQTPWTVSTDSVHGGAAAYGTGDYGDRTCAGLTTPTLHLDPGAELAFWASYQIEANWDKGVVQISTDDGGTWQKINVDYPDTASNTSDQCGLSSGAAFSADQLIDWTHYTAPLDAWAGQDVLIRWLISSDGSVTGAGWWIDDIEITNVGIPGDCTTVFPSDIFADDFESGDTGVWTSSQP